MLIGLFHEPYQHEWNSIVIAKGGNQSTLSCLVIVRGKCT